MNWGIYFLGILSGIIIILIGEILNPTVAEIGAKLHARVWRKPYIKGQLAEDLGILEAIQNPLLKINAIPRYPDSYKNISEWLLEIDNKARKLQTKTFQEIKDKLIEFTSPMKQVSVNTPLDTVSKLFVKDNKAFNLVEEIREFISKTTKAKKKK